MNVCPLRNIEEGGGEGETGDVAHETIWATSAFYQSISPATLFLSISGPNKTPDDDQLTVSWKEADAFYYYYYWVDTNPHNKLRKDTQEHTSVYVLPINTR